MLKTRILTALILLPLMLGMLFYADEHVWAAFCGGVVLLTLWEYSRLAGMPKPMWVTYLALSFACGYAIYKFDYLKLTLIEHSVVLLFWFVVSPLWLKFKWSIKPGFIAFILGWVLLFPFWLALLQIHKSFGPKALLAIMALVWVADIGAYAFGRLFGKHKLAPTISPGKSWEGAVGGCVCVLIYVFAIRALGWWPFELPHFAYWVLFALVFTALSVEGDLLESWFKRSAGIKDSSNLLPGHGGVYDRIDAMISVLSVFAALQAFFVYFGGVV